MTAPWRFRPESPDRPTDGDDAVWEDNWLSNALAFSSVKLMPTWCQTPEHWTSRLTAYLFTDCPCCLLFRGITIGIMMTMIPIVFISILLMVAS